MLKAERLLCRIWLLRIHRLLLVGELRGKCGRIRRGWLLYLSEFGLAEFRRRAAFATTGQDEKDKINDG